MVNPFIDGIFHGFSMINYHLHNGGSPRFKKRPMILAPIPKNGATPGAIPATTLGAVLGNVGSAKVVGAFPEKRAWDAHENLVNQIL